MLKGALAVIVVFSFGFSEAFASMTPHLLPFKVWKHKKIDEAQSVVGDIKREIKKNGEEGPDSISKRQSQAEINLKVAKELSANDYFVLYVIPQFKESREAMLQASKHLSPNDIADILEAYQKTLENGEHLDSKKASNSYEDSP